MLMIDFQGKKVMIDGEHHRVLVDVSQPAAHSKSDGSQSISGSRGGAVQKIGERVRIKPIKPTR